MVTPAYSFQPNRFKRQHVRTYIEYKENGKLKIVYLGPIPSTDIRYQLWLEKMELVKRLRHMATRDLERLGALKKNVKT